jgi:hypothetical protein
MRSNWLNILDGLGEYLIPTPPRMSRRSCSSVRLLAKMAARANESQSRLPRRSVLTCGHWWKCARYSLPRNIFAGFRSWPKALADSALVEARFLAISRDASDWPKRYPFRRERIILLRSSESRQRIAIVPGHPFRRGAASTPLDVAATP